MLPTPHAHERLLASTATAPTSQALRDEIVRLATRLRGFFSGSRYLHRATTALIPASLTPLDSEGRPRQPHQVHLRDLDDWGIAFEHHAPLPDRRAMVAMEPPQFGRVVAEVDVSWCRYLGGGRYASGGRILRVHTQP